jgi:hypothetical protein
MQIVLGKRITSLLIQCILAFTLFSCTIKKADEVQQANSTNPTEALSATTTTLFNKDSINHNSQADSDKKIDEVSMKLGTFTSIPDELTGCGCWFFRSNEDKKANKYIYIDAGHMAMVELNGKVQTFDYKENINGITFYTSDKMQLEVNITKTIERTDLEETVDVEGAFTITKGKEKLVQKFVGSCGC